MNSNTAVASGAPTQRGTLWRDIKRWLSRQEADPQAARRVLYLGWAITRALLVVALVVGRGFADPAFYSDAGQLALGHLPYRDVPVEYPPLAMLLILLPALPLLPLPAWAPRPIANLHALPALPQPDPVRYQAYGLSFAAEMLLIDLLTLWLVRRAAVRLLPGDPTGLRAGLLYLVLVLASGALLQKFDLVLGTLCLFAVLALAERRIALAGVAVGLAALTKGFPVLVLPALAAGMLATVPGRSLAQALQQRRRQLGALVLGCAAVLAGATLLVTLFAGWGPVWATLTYHTQRGTEIESLYGTLELAVGWLPGLHASTAYSPIDLSRVVRSPLDVAVGAVALVVTGTLLALVYLGLWRALARRIRSGGTVQAAAVQLAIAGSTAALLAFELGFRALPAHYLLVILPLVSVLRLPDRRHLWIVLASVFVIALEGQLIAVPAIWNALRHLAPWAVALLGLRNCTWVIAFGILLVSLWQWQWQWQWQWPHQRSQSPAWEIPS